MVPAPPGATADVTGALGSVPSQGNDAIITDETAPDIMYEAENLAAFNAIANTIKTKSVKLLNLSHILTI